MKDSRNNKAVAAVIGVLLIFALLVLLAFIYQTSVVPIQEENKEIEHQRTLTDQMRNLRASIRTSASDISSKTVAIDTGLIYPNGLLGTFSDDFTTPAAGTLASDDFESQIQIRNANGIGSSQNYWTGQSSACPNPNAQPSESENHCFETDLISYIPEYRRQQLAPTLRYENSVVYSDIPTLDASDSQIVPQTSQNIINGKSIDLKSIDAPNITTSSVGGVDVDVTPVSASTNTIQITNNTSEPVKIDIPTNIPADIWKNRLLNEQLADNNTDGYVKAVNANRDSNGDIESITIEMVEGYTYSLKLSKINLMTRQKRTSIEETDPAYVAWRGEGRLSLRENTIEEIPSQVRDKYNNPIVGVRTKATAVVPNETSGGVDCVGSFQVYDTSYSIRDDKEDCDNSGANQPGTRVSGDDGRLSYFYEVPEVERDIPIEVRIEVLPEAPTVSNDIEESSPTFVKNELKKMNNGFSQPVSVDLRRFKHSIIPFDPDKPEYSLRILDVRTPQRAVSVHNSIYLTLIMENDGTRPIYFPDNITGRDADSLIVNPDSIGVEMSPNEVEGSIPPGERKRFTFEITFHTPGYKKLQVKPSMGQEESVYYVDVAEKTSSMSSYLVENSGSIEETINKPSRFKDNDSDPNEDFEDRDIPPVRKQNNTFQDSSQGDLEQFINFQDSSSRTSLDDFSGSDVNIGIAHFRIPETPAYTLETDFDPGGGPYIIRPVGSNGAESQDIVMLAMSGNRSGEKIKYHLSPEQSRKIRNQNEAYFVLNNTGGNQLDLSKIDIRTTEDIVKTTTPNISIDNIRVSDTNPTIIKATVSNNGNESVVENFRLLKSIETSAGDVSSSTEFNFLKSKEILVNPQETKEISFIHYNSIKGTHSYRIGEDNENIIDYSY